MVRKRKTTKEGFYYCLYRGDELLAHGYLMDLADKFQMNEKTIREMAHKSYHERVAKAPNPGKRIIAVKVEELTEEDLVVRHRKRRH